MRLKNICDKTKLFFTSDCHFHHKNIIEYTNGPFGDVKTMDNLLIQNWNKTVSKDDVIFVLGDFVFTGNIDRIRHLVSQLNGIIYLIMGNHDYQNRLDREIVKEIFDHRVMDVCELTVYDENASNNTNNIFMSHYPHMFWHRGSYHLHGHVHSGPDSTTSEKVPFHPMRYNIGVDNNNYTPVSYIELMKIFENYKNK